MAGYINFGGVRGEFKETCITREERLAMINRVGGSLEKHGKLQEQNQTQILNDPAGSAEKAEPDTSSWALYLPERRRGNHAIARRKMVRKHAHLARLTRDKPIQFGDVNDREKNGPRRERDGKIYGCEMTKICRGTTGVGHKMRLNGVGANKSVQRK